ncbi:MAG: T9SS type A sorting domain-containing protein [Bacteroidales bacterium]|nr:T9SS type A sorting domain-containing protein [Bacteroidales bacterium]
MKKLLLSIIALCLVGGLMAQNAPMQKISKKDAAKIAVTHPQILKGTEYTAVPRNTTSMLGNGNFVGGTYYDLQTNGSMAPRTVAYPDGTFSIVWTTSEEGAPTTRGTGYNYFNGTSWINSPTNTSKIENVRTGWPTLAALGNGEIFASHNGSDALVIGVRPQKGTGDWIMTNLYGPAATLVDSTNNTTSTSTCLLWPQMAVNGNTIHLIACTESDAGYLYQGIQTCLVYIRGTFGGTDNTISWEAPRVVGNVTPAQIGQFSGDSYSITANGDYVAILVADSWNDVFMWKSSDNGVTFTKTTIVDSPIPDGYNEATTEILDTPYVADGACAIALTATGNAHVAFGLTRVLNDALGDGSYSYFPGVDGLLYWNESMPAITATRNTLDPDSLILAGYTVFVKEDMDGDDTVWFMDGGNWPKYGLGSISMPQLLVDGNNVYIVYTQTLDYPFVDINSSSYYRGVFGKKSLDGGTTWSTGTSWLSYNKDCFYIDNWTDYTMQTYQDMLWVDGENMFPSITPKVVNGKIGMTWQWDYFAGCEIKENNVSVAGQPSSIYFMQLDANDLGVYNAITDVYNGLCIDSTSIVDNTLTDMALYPNPANNKVTVALSSMEAANATLSIYNLMGQCVYAEPINVMEGNNFISVNISNLNAGVYVVNVKTAQGTSTQKLIVK